MGTRLMMTENVAYTFPAGHETSVTADWFRPLADCARPDIIQLARSADTI